MGAIPDTTIIDEADLAELLSIITDPVERLLLARQIRTVHEAEELYLDEAFPEVLSLLGSDMSDEELGKHPLFVMYRSHGSRPREDSLL
jgi:hypothetical protein